MVAGWLAGRSFDIFSRLSQHNPPVPNLIISPSDPLITGVCYGSPPLHVRPTYKNLAHDELSEDRLQNVGTTHSTPDGECRKYYETYRKAGLVGGLMVLWCHHSICVGFHIIPTCEGRNDVFSALYTQWPTAPKVVVYDFACQLAPYCLVREAKFFQNTRFFVDQFHASSHTKCSKASSSTYAMQFDPSLQVVNTSAAEVGNSGAAKIRKSVSYMTHVRVRALSVPPFPFTTPLRPPFGQCAPGLVLTTSASTVSSASPILALLLIGSVVNLSLLSYLPLPLILSYLISFSYLIAPLFIVETMVAPATPSHSVLVSLSVPNTGKHGLCAGLCANHLRYI
jgi:hypothetical protein